MLKDEEYMDIAGRMSVVPGFPREVQAIVFCAELIEQWTKGNREHALELVNEVARTFEHWAGIPAVDQVFLRQHRQRNPRKPS